MSKLSYTVAEAAEATGLSRRTIYRDIAEGRLKVRKRGAMNLILADDMNAYLAGLPDAEAA